VSKFTPFLLQGCIGVFDIYLKLIIIMNLDIFNLPDPSGKMSKESFLIKNHKEEYKFIINYCIDNDLFDVSFKEKVYLCLNKLSSVPLCENPNCFKMVKFRNSTLGYIKYCSIKCISSDPNIKKIKEEKSLEKWGTKTPAESNIIKEKIIKTNIAKYGGNSAMCSKDIQRKSKETLMKNWNVDSPSRSKEILEKRVESFKVNIEQYKESYKRTSLERYGVDHPWKNKKIHDKSVLATRAIKLEKTFDIIRRMIPDGYQINSICAETSEVNITCDLKHDFISTRSFIYNRARNNSEICTICNPLNSQKSGAEILLVKFIKDIYGGTIIENERNTIGPFEIDIYLPELKLGIEYNGLWWHSSEYREYDYHLIKQKRSIDSGVELITIWEDDWINKPDMIKSFLTYKLGEIKCKIPAKKCKVIELNKKESDLFLEENHWNGKSNSSIRIALVCDSYIVSVMTLKKSSEGYLLDRYCIKKYALVMGGFSKMLNFFVDKYNPSYIINYSDNMYSDGSLYLNFGFDLVSECKPSYSSLVNKNRSHRLSVGDYPKIWNAGSKKLILKKLT
jgi:hypothetical protein